MPTIDYERVLLGLKAHIRENSRNGKKSFGERELLEKLADLEVESRIPEGQENFDPRPVPLRPASSGRSTASSR